MSLNMADSLVDTGPTFSCFQKCNSMNTSAGPQTDKGARRWAHPSNALERSIFYVVCGFEIWFANSSTSVLELMAELSVMLQQQNIVIAFHTCVPREAFIPHLNGKFCIVVNIASLFRKSI